MPVVEERGHRRLEARCKVAKASRRFAAPPRLNVIDELSDLEGGVDDSIQRDSAASTRSRSSAG
jgi:hypothetical protein